MCLSIFHGPQEQQDGLSAMYLAQTPTIHSSHERGHYRHGFSGCRFPALKQSRHTLDADWHEALVSTNVRKAHL